MSNLSTAEAVTDVERGNGNELDEDDQVVTVEMAFIDRMHTSAGKWSTGIRRGRVLSWWMGSPGEIEPLPSPLPDASYAPQSAYASKR